MKDKLSKNIDNSSENLPIKFQYGDIILIINEKQNKFNFKNYFSKFKKRINIKLILLFTFIIITFFVLTNKLYYFDSLNFNNTYINRKKRLYKNEIKTDISITDNKNNVNDSIINKPILPISEKEYIVKKII